MQIPKCVSEQHQERQRQKENNCGIARSNAGKAESVPHGARSRRTTTAVGRTSFWDPLMQLRAKEITRDAAVAEIARRYREFVDIFENARAKTRGALSR
jgi:hypothetical protein